MSTTFDLYEDEELWIAVTESSSLLSFDIEFKMNSHGPGGFRSTERLTPEQVGEIVIKLARAASYSAEDPDQFIRDLVTRIP